METVVSSSDSTSNSESAAPLNGEAAAPGAALPDGPSLIARASKLQYRAALVVLLLPAIAAGYALWSEVEHGVVGWHWGLLAAMYFLTMFGVTAGYHRHFAHRAFKTSKGMRLVLGVLGSMAG